MSDANRIPAVLRAKATEDWRPATLALGEPRDSSPGAIAAQVALTDDGPESRFLFRFTRERMGLPVGLRVARAARPGPRR